MLVDGALEGDGDKNKTKYYVVQNKIRSGNVLTEPGKDRISDYIGIKKQHAFFSEQAIALLGYLDTSSYGRKPSSYQFSALDHYIPNQTQCIPDSMGRRLSAAGRRFDEKLAAGTYAKKLSQCLLIDLSYNSSRLEGNTYSKLDTQKLIEQGQIDVPQDDYLRSLLVFYETNHIQPLFELYEWAYLCSCQQYQVVKEYLGEINVYRMQHQAHKKMAMGHIIRQKLDEAATIEYLSDLAQLHEGSIIGLGIIKSMFIDWEKNCQGVAELIGR